MRIVYVVPGPMSQGKLGAAEVQRRVGKLREWAAPGTEVDIVDSPAGPASIESMYEEYLSIPKTVELMLEQEEEGYDAAILGCYGDPGLDAMREMTSRMYVVGPGEAGAHAAAMLGERFSIVSITQSVVNSTRHQMVRAGLGAKLASVRVIDTPVLELQDDRQRTVRRIAEVGRICMEQDGADTLVLGCMTMAFMDVTDEVSAQLGIPVVNAAKASLKFAEAIAGMGLSHSKAAFMFPPKLADGKVRSARELMVGD